MHFQLKCPLRRRVGGGRQAHSGYRALHTGSGAVYLELCTSSAVRLYFHGYTSFRRKVEKITMSPRVCNCAPRVWTRFIRKSIPLTLGLTSQELITMLFKTGKRTSLLWCKLHIKWIETHETASVFVFFVAKLGQN